MINDSRWPRGAAFLAMSHELLYIRVQVDSKIKGAKGSRVQGAQGLNPLEPLNPRILEPCFSNTPRILEPWNPFKTSS